MKIAILTFPLNNNYGCLLQAYALQTTLEKLGYDVEIINKRIWVLDSFWGWCMRLVKNIILHNIFKRKGRPSSMEVYMNSPKNLHIISANLRDFIDLKLRLSSKVYFLSKVNFKRKLSYDVYVVGSDQVWRHSYLKNTTNYFLDFVPNNRIKVAYAASFGVDSWEYSSKLTSLCSDLLRTFSGVSVRENSAVELCDKYLKVDALHVVDPTFLVLPSEYLKICTFSMINEKFVLKYILDNELKKEKIVNCISEKCSLKIKNIMPKALGDSYGKPLDDCIYASVDEWLLSFSKACFIVTDSFHGCAFSIIFNRPFVVINNSNRGSARITSLLQMFDLSDRLVSSCDDVEKVMNRKINWERVNIEIQRQQEIALKFLYGSIGK